MVKLTIIERMILSYKQFSADFVGDSLLRGFLFYMPALGLISFIAINSSYYFGPRHAFTLVIIFYIFYQINLVKLEEKLRKVQSDVKNYRR